MNNTKTLAIVAVLMTATLVVGTFATVAATQPAFAYAKKPGQDGKKTRDDGSGNSKNGNTVTIEECKDRGSASGFDTAVNQECENLICTHPGENATCVQEGAATPTPTPQPTTGTLLVIKKVACVTVPFPCGQPSDFTLHVTGNNPRPSTSFRGSESGTVVTLDPGPFTVFDEVDDVGVTFTGDCTQESSTATGTIAAGQHLTCTATNFPGQ